MIYQYKLTEKSPYEWHIKDGRTIKSKLLKVSNGWHDGATVHATLEQAIQAAKDSLECRLCAFGGDNTVQIK